MGSSTRCEHCFCTGALASELISCNQCAGGEVVQYCVTAQPHPYAHPSMCSEGAPPPGSHNTCTLKPRCGESSCCCCCLSATAAAAAAIVWQSAQGPNQCPGDTLRRLCACVPRSVNCIKLGAAVQGLYGSSVQKRTTGFVYILAPTHKLDRTRAPRQQHRAHGERRGRPPRPHAPGTATAAAAPLSRSCRSPAAPCGPTRRARWLQPKASAHCAACSPSPRHW